MKKEVCPECNGDGWVVGSVAAHGCDGTEEMCAQVCPVEEQVQEWCSFCGGAGEIEVEKPSEQA